MNRVTGPEEEALVRAVQERYAEVARRAAARRGSGASAGCSEQASCCSPGETGSGSAGSGSCCAGRLPYSAEELALVPPEALAASAGCGNPVALADLHPGEVVLDLGSGGGLDGLLAARRVGPGGFVWGLDMTEEMLALAEENRHRSGLEHVTFLRGRIEAVPLPDESVDVVISNCVINLSVDKAAVLREAARVLRPGGRLAVYDIVATRPLSGAVRRALGAWAACVGGALEVDTYGRLLREAGFEDVEVQPVAAVEALPVQSAFVRGRKPGLPALDEGAVRIELASSGDLAAVVHLVRHVGLPDAGTGEHTHAFWVARRRAGSAETVIGAAGLELYGSQALLRSVAVSPPFQGLGVGRRLVEAALEVAGRAGADEIYLLTTTAGDYFARLGFERVERAAVAGPVTTSIEWREACPPSAVTMRLALSG